MKMPGVRGRMDLNNMGAAGRRVRPMPMLQATTPGWTAILLWLPPNSVTLAESLNPTPSYLSFPCCQIEIMVTAAVLLQFAFHFCKKHQNQKQPEEERGLFVCLFVCGGFFVLFSAYSF